MLRILMARSAQGLGWRLVFTCIAVSCFLANLPRIKSAWQGGGVVADVQGQPITRQQLEEALRAHVWKNNTSWASLGPEGRSQVRSLVLESLVNDRLLRAARSAGTLNNEAPRSAAKLESDRLHRQFADPAEFSRRLAAQHLTPRSLETQIYEAQLDEAWLAAQIQPRIHVTSQEVRVWYDKHKETLRIPQAHHAAHIFLSRHDETKPDRTAEMRAIHRQLLAKEKTFAQLALKYSEDERTKASGGDLGWFTQARMPADFITAVQKLPVGQFSEPVQTRLGWHLILVLDRRPSRLPSLADVQDEIAALLITKCRKEAVNELLAALRQALLSR